LLGRLAASRALAVMVATLWAGGPAAGQVGSDPVLVGAGDIGSCRSFGDEATAGLLAGIDGTVATFGDNAYPRGTDADFAECYNPSWGLFKARTLPSPGNHEYETAGASGYFDYFGAAAGDPNKGYYSYDLGSWHVVVLNSNCSFVVGGGCAAGSDQEQWLKADLAAHSNVCTLAYWHHPRFSSGIHGDESSVAPFWDDLYQAGAEVVLNGHDHSYDRFAPLNPSGQTDPAQGIRQFTVGTGGAELTEFKSINPTSEVQIAGMNGVLQMTLHSDGYDWKFITAPNGTEADTGSASCHGAPSGSPTDTTSTTSFFAAGTTQVRERQPRVPRQARRAPRVRRAPPPARQRVPRVQRAPQLRERALPLPAPRQARAPRERRAQQVRQRALRAPRVRQQRRPPERAILELPPDRALLEHRPEVIPTRPTRA
jgi:hypothetical protein